MKLKLRSSLYRLKRVRMPPGVRVGMSEVVIIVFGVVVVMILVLLLPIVFLFELNESRCGRRQVSR